MLNAQGATSPFATQKRNMVFVCGQFYISQKDIQHLAFGDENK